MRLHIFESNDAKSNRTPQRGRRAEKPMSDDSVGGLKSQLAQQAILMTRSQNGYIASPAVGQNRSPSSVGISNRGRQRRLRRKVPARAAGGSNSECTATAQGRSAAPKSLRACGIDSTRVHHASRENWRQNWAIRRQAKRAQKSPRIPTIEINRKLQSALSWTPSLLSKLEVALDIGFSAEEARLRRLNSLQESPA